MNTIYQKNSLEIYCAVHHYGPVSSILLRIDSARSWSGLFFVSFNRFQSFWSNVVWLRFLDFGPILTTVDITRPFHPILLDTQVVQFLAFRERFHHSFRLATGVRSLSRHQQSFQRFLAFGSAQGRTG